MSIERVYHCDGPENTAIPNSSPQPDGCPHHVKALVVDADYLPGGIIEIRRHVQGSIYERFHFCSWDCVMRYAANQRPVEYFDAGGEGQEPA